MREGVEEDAGNREKGMKRVGKEDRASGREKR